MIKVVTTNDKSGFPIKDSNNFVNEVSTKDDGLTLACFHKHKLSNMFEDSIKDETNIDETDSASVIVSAYFDVELLMLEDKQSLLMTPFGPHLPQMSLGCS